VVITDGQDKLQENSPIEVHAPGAPMTGPGAAVPTQQAVPGRGRGRK
jgi:hypothetical protein